MSRTVPRTESEEWSSDVGFCLVCETMTMVEIDPVKADGVRRIVAILSPTGYERQGAVDDISAQVRSAQRVALRIIATAREGSV